MSSNFKHVRMYSTIVAIAYVLHFVWEYFAIRLYTGYEALGSGLYLTMWATAGDVLYTLFIVSLVALFRRDYLWMEYQRVSDLITMAVLGIGVGIFVEMKAMYLARWAYTEAMPLLPGLDIGVVPVMQMMLLAPLAVWLASLLYSRNESI